MPCSLTATQLAACASGIGKEVNLTKLLQLIVQLTCEAAQGGGNGGATVYRALLNQSGTGQPMATELQNTVGAIVWSRVIAGRYVGQLNGVFLANKTWFSILRNQTDDNNYQSAITIKRVNNTILQVETYDITNTLADGILINHPIEILVYS